MGDEQVRVTMPCSARFVRVARTAAAACGVLEGFTVDELGDLRLLVDEVFVAMFELGVTLVELVLTPDHGQLELVMAAVGELGPPRGAADPTFARSLAGIVASEVRFELDGPRPSFAATLVTTG